MYEPKLSIAEGKDEKLFLDIYPEDGECVYLHYQDNGEDFAYLNGEYNLYSLKYKNKELLVDMMHQGYEGIYQKIEMLDLNMRNEKI